MMKLIGGKVIANRSPVRRRSCGLMRAGRVEPAGWQAIGLGAGPGRLGYVALRLAGGGELLRLIWASPPPPVDGVGDASGAR